MRNAASKRTLEGVMARTRPSGPYGQGRADPALERARQWAYTLDTRFEVLGIRFGLDAILGLVPGLGDLVTVAGGLIMVTSAHRLGLSGWVKAKITFFTVVDFVLGSIPVLGDIFDIAYKSHLYSLRAIERALERESRAG